MCPFTTLSLSRTGSCRRHGLRGWRGYLSRPAILHRNALRRRGMPNINRWPSNATAEGRAENRRVDLVVKPRTTTDLAMPDGDRKNSNWHTISE